MKSRDPAPGLLFHLRTETAAGQRSSPASSRSRLMLPVSQRFQQPVLQPATRPVIRIGYQSPPTVRDWVLREQDATGLLLFPKKGSCRFRWIGMAKIYRLLPFVSQDDRLFMTEMVNCTLFVPMPGTLGPNTAPPRPRIRITGPSTIISDHQNRRLSDFFPGLHPPPEQDSLVPQGREGRYHDHLAMGVLQPCPTVRWPWQPILPEFRGRPERKRRN